MIANALFISTECPPKLNEVKRALLTYDQINFYAPDNRDVIPAHFFFQASGTPIPIGIASGPVRPLGKVANYDDDFSQVLDACKAAVEQNIVKVLDTPESLIQRLVLGLPAPPKDYFDPLLSYHVYRALAEQPEFINVISRGLDDIASNAQNRSEELAPAGMDENSINLFGEVNIQGTQPESLYKGFTASKEESEVLARLCLARLATTVKGLGTCEMLGLQPYTYDSGIAGAIQQINRSAADYLQINSSNDEERQVQNRLSQLHRVIIAEYLNDDLLSELSIRDVIRMRSINWGQARENRSFLETALNDLATEDMSPEQFERICKQAVEQYLQTASDWQHEARTLGVKIMCSVGSLPLGGVGGTSEWVEKLVGLPTWTAIAVLGALALNAGKEQIPSFMEVLKHRSESNALPGYALVRPYGNFFKPR